MEKYLNYLKRNKYSINTIKTYENILNNYKDIFQDIRLIKKKLFEYIDKPNTIWTHYNVLCSYMKFNNDRRINLLKQVKLPPIPQKYMPVFTKNYLIKKTNDLTNYKNIIVRFLFETGIRASELNSFIVVDDKTILVKGKGSKQREIFHNNETTKLFTSFDQTTKTLRLWVKEVLGEQYTPHSIRRSHATHMLLNGADPKVVMLQLGHSKIETTYRYLQISKEKNRKIYNKYY